MSQHKERLLKLSVLHPAAKEEGHLLHQEVVAAVVVGLLNLGVHMDQMAENLRLLSLLLVSRNTSLH